MSPEVFGQGVDPNRFSRAGSVQQSQILRAEGEKQSAILEAEGRREAAFRDAEAREREAAAEAEATRAVSEAIAAGDVNAINYFLGQEYVQAFKSLATSKQQRTVIVPADFAGIASAIEGIAALTGSAKDGSGSDDGGSSGEGGPWTRG